MIQCEFDNCTREIGHSGPHGIAVGGMVLAPYGIGTEGTVLEPIESKNPCNICGAKMMLHKYSNGGGKYTCISCDQTLRVNPDGGTSSTILKALYPETHPGDKLWLEYANYKCSQWLFDLELRLECNIENIDEEEQRISIKELLDKAINDHNQALALTNSKSIFTRIKEWFSVHSK